MRLIGLAVVFALSLVLAPPFAGEAQQQAEKVYRVGWIVSSPTATPHLQAAFRLGLSERGYVEGKNPRSSKARSPPISLSSSPRSSSW
jgi:hypothetical protein